MKKFIGKCRAVKEKILTSFLVVALLTVVVSILENVFAVSLYQNPSISYELVTVVSLLPLILFIIGTVLILVYLSVSLDTKLNKILLAVLSLVSVLSLIFTISYPFLQPWLQPSGPDFSVISTEYNSLLADHSKAEADTLLVDWMKQQKDVKDARISSEEGPFETIFYTIGGPLGDSYDSSYSLESLVGDNAYNSCIDSCPPEGMENAANCLEICESSLGTGALPQ